ncbi:MAG TPA: hypothetical protein VM942_00670, partial [Acidimicrobiales bacterium]|nr:hypothetical protein [Acidimicrobiales bacterium]
TACWQHGSVVRLVTTDGVDSGFGSGAGHLELVLSRLAVLEPTPDPGGRGLNGSPGAGMDRGIGIGSLGPQRAVDGAVAVITTTAVEAADLDRLTRLGRLPSAVTLVAFEARSPRQEAVRWPAIGHVVAVAANQSFAAAWDSTLTLGPSHLRRTASSYRAGPR